MRTRRRVGEIGVREKLQEGMTRLKKKNIKKGKVKKELVAE